MEFLREHIALKDTEVLFHSVIKIMNSLIENEYVNNFKDAFYMACILISFPFAGDNELSYDHLLKISEQIVNDCVEYAKENEISFLK